MLSGEEEALKREFSEGIAGCTPVLELAACLTQLRAARMSLGGSANQRVLLVKAFRAGF